MSKNKDLDFSFGAVTIESRRGMFSMFVIMLGFTFFSASMWTGGTLGIGLTGIEFIFAVLVGNLILGIFTGALGHIGSKTGLSTHILAKYSFGEKGSYLGSFLLALTQIGWFGVGVSMFAIPVNKIYPNIDIKIIVAISGILMTGTAYFGIKAVTILSAIAVPSIAILGGTSVINAVNHAGGIKAVMSISPVAPISVMAGIGMCIASFISGGSLTADFSRFAKNSKIGVISTVVAFFLGNSLMFIFGAVGGKVFGTSDISDVMFTQGIIVPAIIVLGFNIWTTNDNALYSSGLGFSSITKVSKSKMVTINGVLGTIFALPLYNNFIGWLALLNTLLPGIGAIIICDFFFVNKGEYKKMQEMEFVSINYVAILAWLTGVVSAKILPGIAPINNVIITMFVYYLGIKVTETKKGVKYAN
ncbi:MAG: cytosine permease [Fusobacteriaceae bacterium]